MNEPRAVDPEELLAHAAWVRNLARSLVIDESRADDVAQDTWVTALQRGSVRALDPRAWLGGIARNKARESSRADGRRARRELAAPEREPSLSADELVERAELSRRVVLAVIQLGEPHRSTLLKRFFQELSAEEIARRDGLPASTVRNRLKRGLELLRERFDAEHGGKRASWAIGMVSLARTGEASFAGPVAPSSAAVLSGAGLMGIKVWMAVTLAVGAGSAAMWAAYSYQDASAAAQAPVSRSVESRAPENGAATGEAMELAQATPAQREPAPNTTPAKAARVAGRVRDAAGKPMAGVRVFVGGRTNPFDGAPQALVSTNDAGEIRVTKRPPLPEIAMKALDEGGVYAGVLLTTDEAGAFAVELPRPVPVLAGVVRETGVAALPAAGSCFEPPYADVVLAAKRIPTSTVTLTVRDRANGATLPSFVAAFDVAGSEQREFEVAVGRPLASRDGTLEHTLELPRAAASTVRVRLVEPLWAAAHLDVELSPGGRRAVEFAVDSGEGFAGRVLDSFGQPLEGALVFWGAEDRLRGRNWNGAFDAANVGDGVRSDVSGRFELPGTDLHVTAWHAENGVATLEREQAREVRIPRQGAIDGLARDASGAVIANCDVELDRTRTARTNASGRYHFDDVGAGAHWLVLPSRRQLGGVVTPGEALDLGDPRFLELVEFDLFSGGEPFMDKFAGVAVGLGPVYSVHEFRNDSHHARMEDVIPGRFVLASSNGHVGVLEVLDAQARLELGTAVLRVRAAPGTRVYLVPPGSHSIAHQLVAHTAQTLGDNGEVRFGPLTETAWVVAIPGRGGVETVQVSAPETSVQL